jgi:hypothetical protein
MNKLLYEYKNGNYNVKIYKDGTKIRENDLDYFDASFPESMDVKITNCCQNNCVMCHENSTPDGIHGNLNHKFLDTLKPGMEIAIGGGNPIEHPDLLNFLNNLKDNDIIANMTLRDTDVLKNTELVIELLNKNLITALGISCSDVKKTLQCVDILESDNIVIHLICGIVSMNELRQLVNKNLKILLLGYKKNTGRGKLHYQNNKMIDLRINMLKSLLSDIIPFFKVVSFDNLAIEQLSVKTLLSKEQWDEFYMGNEGQHSMYIDLVKEQFAMNSTAELRHGLLDDLEDMFDIIKNGG